MATGLAVKHLISNLYIEHFCSQFSTIPKLCKRIDYGTLYHYSHLHSSCNRKAQPRLTPQEVSIIFIFIGYDAVI